MHPIEDQGWVKRSLNLQIHQTSVLGHKIEKMGTNQLPKDTIP